MWRTLLFCLFNILLSFASISQAAPDVPQDCGSLTNNYGPYDYQNSQHRQQKLPIVEQYHLTPKVRSLRAGQTSVTPGPDLDYVLRAFPNHIPALYLMTRYQKQLKSANLPREN